jgi:hypothetical protein
MSNQVGAFRRALRHEILNMFPGFSSKAIYEQLKNPGMPVLVLSDLQQVCVGAKIPVSFLNGIFSSYNVFNSRISEEKFAAFLQDEVTCKGPTTILNPDLTKDQIQGLVAFVTAVKNRRTQAYWTQNGLSSERVHPSNIWVSLVKLNPQGSEAKFLRLATICRLVDDLDLGINVEDFIGAIFLFFGRKLERIDFDQFTQLIDAFG